MTTTKPRIALLCIDPLRNDVGDFKPFNYSIRKIQAAVLADPKLGADVQVFEYDSEDVNEFVDLVERGDPDIVGASAYVWSFPTFYEVARRLKRSRPDRLIVFGGPSARTEMFDLPPFRDGAQFVDVLVLGEGEEVFQEIVALEDRSRDRLRSVKGIAVSTGEAWFQTPIREMPTLDTLASPFQMGLVPEVKTGHLETFRGCPLSCTFCQWGDLSKANRTFSVDYLVRELSSYASMALRSVMIVDAALNLNLRAFRNLVAAERQVGFFKKAFLHAEVYPQYLNDEHLDFLRGVGGGLNLGLGLQSYNREVLGNVERPFDEKRFERVVAELLRITPRSEIEIIMGLPGDNPDSFRATLHRALGLGASVRVYHCLVLPNALMSRAPASFAMTYDPINLSMHSCLGWENGAIQRMSEELTSLTQSIPGAFLHNDGFGWHFPSDAEAKKGEHGWHFMLSIEDAKAARSANGEVADVPDAPATEATPSPDASSQRSGSRPRIAPEMRDAFASAIAQATGGAWRWIDGHREPDLLTLEVGTPAGDLRLDIRRATDETKCFKSIDGFAYSYRRTEHEISDHLLGQFESIIEQMRPLTPIALGSPAVAEAGGSPPGAGSKGQ